MIFLTPVTAEKLPIELTPLDTAQLMDRPFKFDARLGDVRRSMSYRVNTAIFQHGLGQLVSWVESDWSPVHRQSKPCSS
jgi:hypothetical protein